MDASREEAGGWIEAARLLKEVAYVSFILPMPRPEDPKSWLTLEVHLLLRP